MFKAVRISILLFVLFFVSVSTWLTQARSTDWNNSLWVKVYPINGEIRYYHGLILLQNGQREQGLAELRAAIELEPRLLAPRRLMASELLGLRQHAAAAEQMEAVLALEPDDLYTLVTFATYLAQYGDDSGRARELIARADRLAPQDPSVIDGRAWLAYLAGDRATARRIVEQGGRYYENEPLFLQRRQRILQVAP